MHNKCPRCNKIISKSVTVVTVKKQVGESISERECQICDYCMEDLEEFLRGKEEESNE